MFSFLKQYFYFISNEKPTEKVRGKMGQNGKWKLCSDIVSDTLSFLVFQSG